ncbi:MAG: CHAD domain-containing protein [Bacteroidota bacterium]|nr:CHAD domain-containing protein [Bacteroidota bacterium]
MSSNLQRYFSQRVKNIFNHLHDFELTGGEIPLHDLRVEMKKLKALLKFLRSVYGKQRTKKAKFLLDTIFQQAGEIRELQILVNWLTKHQLLHIEEQFFPGETMQLKIAAFQQRAAIYKKDLQEIIECCSELIDNTNTILAEQYIVQIRSSIEKILSKNPDKLEWHELRKIIKQWMYAINWIKPEDMPVTENVFPFYNKLQEAIGIWHDKEMIKGDLSKKQIYLSQDFDVQKDFGFAWNKITQSIKYREKLVEEMLHNGNSEIAKQA